MCEICWGTVFHILYLPGFLLISRQIPQLKQVWTGRGTVNYPKSSKKVRGRDTRK